MPDNPTLADVLASGYPILVEGWTAEHEYAADLLSTDATQFLHPTGDDNVFGAEVFSGSLTSSSEPDWSSAPSLGDEISDGDLTWVNAGPAVDFPPAPTTWAPATTYPWPSFVWPTVPNGHLYVTYPPTPAGTIDPSDGTEPSFPTSDHTYIADDGGYWFDVGTGDLPAPPSGNITITVIRSGVREIVFQTETALFAAPGVGFEVENVCGGIEEFFASVPGGRLRTSVSFAG